MIIVLHGDNQVASRNRFRELRQEFENKNRQILTLDGKTTDFNQIKIAAASGSLLGEGIAVFIENFWSRKRPPAQRASGLEGNVVFWEQKELSRNLIQNFPKEWEAEYFPIPRLVFRFLEEIAPGNSLTTLKLLHNVVEREPMELVLPLLAWHTRQLIWAKIEPKTITLPSWKKNKLTHQSSKFTTKQLLNLHNWLLEIDRGVKTGSSPLSLSTHLDLLIASI